VPKPWLIDLATWSDKPRAPLATRDPDQDPDQDPDHDPQKAFLIARYGSGVWGLTTHL
jgi:hypothetical protein